MKNINGLLKRIKGLHWQSNKPLNQLIHFLSRKNNILALEAMNNKKMTRTRIYEKGDNFKSSTKIFH